MAGDQEQRAGDDRRADAVYCRYGSERRESSERRCAAMSGGECQARVGGELWPDYWGAAEDGVSSE
jgi:hypothetical protein